MPRLEIPANEIYGAPRRSEAVWPKRSPTSRLGTSCSPVITPKFDLKSRKSFFAIGSCFARNVEEHLVRTGLLVASREISFPRAELFGGSRANDLLVKFTPSSIVSELTGAFIDDIDLESVPIDDGRGVFFDPYLPMTYPGVTYERCVERRRQVRQVYRKIENVDAVILTLGLIEDWYDTKLGIYMNSGPTAYMVRSHPNRFTFRVLSFDENLATTRRCLDIIHQVNPAAKVIITTSPVPLGRTFTHRDVLVANTYSKSMLRVIAQDVADERDYVDYFPSYETVMLSEKLEAWEDDQRHVLDTKVGEIMASFMSHYLGETPGRSVEILAEAKRAKEKGMHKESFEKYKLVEKVFSNDTRVMTDFCDVALAAKKLSDVIRIGKSILEFDPTNGRAGLFVAQALVNLRRLDEAEELCNKLISFPHQKIRAHRWLMEIAKMRCRYDEAASQAHVILGLIQQGRGSLPESILERVRQAAKSPAAGSRAHLLPTGAEA